MQNSAARLVTHTKKHAHISPILKSLHWLLIDRQIQFKILLLTFRCLYVQAPSYLTDLIQVSMPTTQLKDSSKLILKILLLKPNLWKHMVYKSWSWLVEYLARKTARRTEPCWIQKAVKNTPIRLGVYCLKRCEPFSKVETALYKQSFIIVSIIFPQSCKTAKIVPRFKSVNTQNFTNCWPIFILTH